MALFASVQNNATMVVTGLDPEIDGERWRVWLEDVAELIEQDIAKAFDAEKAAGKALKEVSEDHEQRKARDGLDLRLGHMYGELQDELDIGGFFKVGIVRAGRVLIRFDENALYARVAHAEWYARDKVHGGRILKVLPKHAGMATDYLRKRHAEWAAGTAIRRRRATPERQVRDVGAGLVRRAVGALFRLRA